jgi:outer membrane lipoprotein-sorting protein
MIRSASDIPRLLVCLFAAAASASAANSLEAAFERIDHAAQGFTGLTADVTKISYQAIIQDQEKDTGKLTLKKSKREVRMLLDIRDPDHIVYSFDPHEVKRYLPKAQTEEIYEPGKYKSLIDQFLLLGFGTTSKDLQSNYTVALGGPDNIGQEQTTRLQLTPKSQEMLKYFRRIDLWISDATGVPVQQKFISPSGDYNLATYSNIMVNPNLPDSAVRFDPPKGTKIVHPQK